MGVKTIWHFFARRGLTFKKAVHASKQARDDVRSRREARFEDQPDLDPERLMFIDETWTATKPLLRRVWIRSYKIAWWLKNADRRSTS